MSLISRLNAKKKTVCVLSIDMGIKNSCMSVTHHTRNKVEWINTEMLPVTVVDMGKQLEPNTKMFIAVFTRLLDRYKPDLVSPELFMQRSFRSNLASPINYMIGIMAHACDQRGIKFIPVMPSLWKRRVEKELTKLEKLYDRTYPIAQRLPDHPIDSLFIGIYHNEKFFKCLTVPQAKAIIQQIKGSTSIQNWLEKEHSEKKQKSKRDREKKKKKPSEPKKSKAKTPATKAKRTPAL